MKHPYPAKKLNKADMVYEILREGITSGEWQPGDRLYDNELADRFGTSRNSVREALSNLVENRLVEKEHWKGYRVRTPEWDEIAEAIDIRETLEVYVMQKVVELPEDKFESLIIKLEEHLAEAKELLDTKSTVSIKKDMNFHEIVYKTISKYWLDDIICELHAITDLQMNNHFKLYPEVQKLSHMQHMKIFEKLKERDFEGLKIAVQEHLESYKERAREAYLASISSNEDDD